MVQPQSNLGVVSLGTAGGGNHLPTGKARHRIVNGLLLLAQVVPVYGIILCEIKGYRPLGLTVLGRSSFPAFIAIHHRRENFVGVVHHSLTS